MGHACKNSKNQDGSAVNNDTTLSTKISVDISKYFESFGIISFVKEGSWYIDSDKFASISINVHAYLRCGPCRNME